MIIFDLASLANDAHRRHFIDPNHKNNKHEYIQECFFESGNGSVIPQFKISYKTRDDWSPDWSAYHDACDEDRLIEQTMRIFGRLWIGEKPVHVEIWSDRPEYLRQKTHEWLINEWFIGLFDHEKEILNKVLKMRPLGDDRPDERLFENWYDLHNPRQNLEMVFSANPAVIAMFRRRNIFVFDCNQQKKQ